jgi:hypothetical protein
MLCAEVHIKLWSVTLVERAHLGVLYIDEKIILKFILKDTDLDATDWIYLAYDRDQ